MFKTRGMFNQNSDDLRDPRASPGIAQAQPRPRPSPGQAEAQLKFSLGPAQAHASDCLNHMISAIFGPSELQGVTARSLRRYEQMVLF